jgi:serine/threonine-protein kinase
VPGEVLFDRYLVERKLGEGGMGTVWLVRHLEFDSPRALKLIVSGIALDEQTRARFKREARIMDRLNHPNVVRVYNASLGKETAFIEMEYIQGHSLNTVLRPGVPMPLDEVTNLLDQLCDVLQAANDEGIIHRDLKPSNLIVLEPKASGRRMLKLLDFGIAKIRSGEGEDALTRTGLFLGTPLYSSPEQIQGGKVDSRSDLYSLGVLLYEMLTGYRPFSGSLTALICSHTTVPPPSFREINPSVRVPEGVEQVVMACLAKDPDDRPQSPRELAEMFHAALGTASPLTVAPNPRTESMTGRGSGLSTTWPMNVDTSTTEPGFGLSPRPPALAPTVFPPTAVNAPVPAPRVSRLRVAMLAGSFLGFIGLAVALGALAMRSRERSPEVLSPVVPKGTGATVPPTVPIDPKLRRHLERWALAGLVPDRAAGSSGGWPNVLVNDEEIRFHRLAGGGIYLPEGYEPADPKDVDPEDGKPRVLVRSSDGTEFVRIAGRRFKMGCLDEAITAASDPTRPAHWVTVSGFYLQKTEVTNREIERFLLDSVPGACSEWRRIYQKLAHELQDEELAGKHPAVGVPYGIARVFARKRGGNLPTEAQWEFAARSLGKDYYYVWDSKGDRTQSISELANLSTTGVNDYLTAPVGSFPGDATRQGVLDLSGNVRELCRDEWHPYTAEERVDPDFAPHASNDPEIRIVVRGGSYLDAVGQGRTIDRADPISIDGAQPNVGFRLVLECPEEY